MENTERQVFEDRLVAAVEAIEARSGVELVVAVVPRVHTYYANTYLYAMVITLFVYTTLMYMPAVIPTGLVYVCTIAAFVVPFALIELVPMLKRGINRRSAMRKQVELHARSTFQHNQLTETSQRTGLLMYLAEFEQEAVLIGDIGVESELEPVQIQALEFALREALKSSNPDGAIINLLHQRKDFFATHFPPPSPNFDELPSHLIID